MPTAYLLLREVLPYLEHLLLGDVTVVVLVEGVEGPLGLGVGITGRGRTLAEKLLAADVTGKRKHTS